MFHVEFLFVGFVSVLCGYNIFELNFSSKKKEKKQNELEVLSKLKQPPKQLKLGDGTAKPYEDDLIAFLHQQIEKTESKNLYPFSLKEIINRPQGCIKLELWPIATFPQYKTVRYFVKPYFVCGQKNQEVWQGSGLGDLLMTLVLVRWLRSENLAVPIMMNFPTVALNYPRLVQHVCDYFEEKDLFTLKALWLVGDISDRQKGVMKRLVEIGADFATSLSGPVNKVDFSAAHMSWNTYEKYSNIEDYRTVSYSMGQFVSQPFQTILGDVPEGAEVSMPFDAMYGPLIGKATTLGLSSSDALSKAPLAS